MCYNFSGFRAETERVGGAVSYLLKEHGIPTVPPADSACSDLWEVLDLCAHIFCLGEKRMRVQSWAMRDAIKNGWFAYTLEPGVSSEFDGLAQKLAWYLDLSFRVEASVNDKILNAFIEIIELCLREKEHSNSNDNDSVLCFVPNAYFEVVLNPGITGERSLFDPKVLLLLFALAEQDVLVNPDLKRSLSAALLGLLGNPLSTAIFGSQILAQGYAKALLALLARDEAALLRFFSPETDKESLGRVLRAERCGGLVDSFFDRVFELVNKTFTDLQMEMSQLETRNGAKLSLPYAKSLFAHAGRGASCMAGLEAVTHLFSAEVVVGRELNFFRMCEFAVYLLDRIPAYTKYLAEIFGGGYRGGNGSGSSDDDDDDVHIIASYEISLMKVLNELCIMCKGDYGRMENMLGRFANFRLSSLTRLAEAHKDVVPKEFADLCTFLKQHKDGKSTGTKCNKSNGSNNTKDSSPAPTDEEEEEHDVVKEALEQSSLDDSSLCEICYTNKKDTVFVPCGHSSCRLCIERHMTTEKTCFFCKKEITTLKSN